MRNVGVSSGILTVGKGPWETLTQFGRFLGQSGHLTKSSGVGVSSGRIDLQRYVAGTKSSGEEFHS